MPLVSAPTSSSSREAAPRFCTSRTTALQHARPGCQTRLTGCRTALRRPSAAPSAVSYSIRWAPLTRPTTRSMTQTSTVHSPEAAPPAIWQSSAASLQQASKHQIIQSCTATTSSARSRARPERSVQVLQVLRQNMQQSERASQPSRMTLWRSWSCGRAKSHRRVLDLRPLPLRAA